MMQATACASSEISDSSPMRMPLPDDIRQDPDFIALWTVWGEARGGNALPAHGDVHLENLEERITWTSVFLWENRDLLTDCMAGSGVVQASGSDRKGANLFDVIHKNHNGEAKTGFEDFAAGNSIGVGEFSSDMQSGLSVLRQSFFLPMAADEPGTLYFLAFTRHLQEVNYPPRDRVVAFCKSHLKISLFDLVGFDLAGP